MGTFFSTDTTKPKPGAGPQKKSVVLAADAKPKKFAFDFEPGRFPGVNKFPTNRSRGPLQTSDLRPMAEAKKTALAVAQKKAAKALQRPATASEPPAEGKRPGRPKKAR